MSGPKKGNYHHKRQKNNHRWDLTLDQMAASKKRCKVDPCGATREVPPNSDIKALTRDSHVSTGNPFDGVQKPEEVKGSPARASLWKKYTKAMKSWWIEEMNQERRGKFMGADWAKAGRATSREIERRGG